MADVLPAIHAYLEDLAAGSVAPREKPTALQYGLLATAADEIERLRMQLAESVDEAGRIDNERHGLELRNGQLESENYYLRRRLKDLYGEDVGDIHFPQPRELPKGDSDNG